MALAVLYGSRPFWGGSSAGSSIRLRLAVTRVLAARPTVCLQLAPDCVTGLEHKIPQRRALAVFDLRGFGFLGEAMDKMYGQVMLESWKNLLGANP